MRWLAIVPLTLGAAYLAVCAAVFFLQRGMLFPAPRASLREPPANVGYQRLKGAELLYLPGEPGAPVVVHFHGNGEQVLDTLDLGEALQTEGLGFLAVEYPGYGFAPGAPTEEGIYAAAVSALEWVKAERVVLSGQSIGTGVAVEMARRGYGERVALFSPYTSVTALAALHFSWLPTGLLVRDRFDSAAKAPQIHQPVLIVHGEQDDLIPIALGEELAKRFPKAQLVRVAGAGHNDLWSRRELVPLLVKFARGTD
jgi:pimeloyl-ACP methyl ester carboxylesterase